jgi:hypothetical protein
VNIVIVRSRLSANFKIRQSQSDSWDNNKANNLADTFWMFDGSDTLFATRVQTVANLPGGRPQDTIAPGKFRLRLFADPRDFWCVPHGVVGAKDLEGQDIDGSSVESVPGRDGAPTSFDRWLCHDMQKHRHNPDGTTNPRGTDTSVAWSAGCIVQRTVEFARFNLVLAKKGLKKDDEVVVELKMEVWS